MSISSIGSSLQPYLQGIAANTSAALSSAASAISTTASSLASNASTGTTTGSSSAHHHSHTALKAIQNAVSQALQQAKNTGSDEDPNQIVEDAIAKIFKNGLASPDQTSAQDTLSGQTPDDMPTANSYPDASTNTFLQALQQFGIDPHQFQKDFTNAVKDAQSGVVNLGSALQSFGKGSLVDVTG